MLGTNALSTRTKVSEDLAIALAEPFVRGDIEAGAAIESEVDLAERFGVSRPVAREAVQMLALAGMLQVQHGKRTTVRAEREWNVLSPTVQTAFERVGRGDALRAQLYEVRLVLETACAGYTAQRATEEEREGLKEILHSTEMLSRKPGGLRDFLELDRQFHGMMASFAGNLALSQLTREVQGYLASSWTESHLTESEMVESGNQHMSVGAAVLAGDAAAAREAMEHHIRWAAAIERVSADKGGDAS